jgi:hypothetical protein
MIPIFRNSRVSVNREAAAWSTSIHTNMNADVTRVEDWLSLIGFLSSHDSTCYRSISNYLPSCLKSIIAPTHIIWRGMPCLILRASRTLKWSVAAQWFSFLPLCVVEVLPGNSEVHSGVNTDNYATVVTKWQYWLSGLSSAYKMLLMRIIRCRQLVALTPRHKGI